MTLSSVLPLKSLLFLLVLGAFMAKSVTSPYHVHPSFLPPPGSILPQFGGGCSGLCVQDGPNAFLRLLDLSKRQGLCVLNAGGLVTAKGEREGRG